MFVLTVQRLITEASRGKNVKLNDKYGWYKKFMYMLKMVTR